MNLAMNIHLVIAEKVFKVRSKVKDHMCTNVYCEGYSTVWRRG